MPTNDELMDMVKRLEAELEKLRRDVQPGYRQQRSIRLAAKDGEPVSGVQSIKFLNGDGSERRSVAWEVAKPLGSGQVAVFELDGLWFIVSSDQSVCSKLKEFATGTPADGTLLVAIQPDGSCELIPSPHNCICAALEKTSRQKTALDSLTTRVEALENA